MATRSAGSAVCPEIIMAMTLGYLAGSAVWGIQSIFNLSTGKFYSSVWRFVDSINGRLQSNGTYQIWRISNVLIENLPRVLDDMVFLELLVPSKSA